MGYTQLDLIATGVTFPAVGFVLVCLRFWMRLRFQRIGLGIDDWCILFASVLVIGMAVNSILGSYIGVMGMDDMRLDSSRELPQKKLDFSVLVFEKPAYGAIKLSVLLFYRRIFTLRRFRTINNVLIGVIVAWTIAFFCADLFDCGIYFSANWDPKMKAVHHCINLFVMLLIFAITDVLTDIAIMWMPYPEIKRLQMSARDRWALAGVFLLGGIDLVIGIVRLGFIVANQTIPAVRTDFNPPEQTAPTFWTVLEVGIGVIAANLPALAPLVRERARLGTMAKSSIQNTFSRSRLRSTAEFPERTSRNSRDTSTSYSTVEQPSASSLDSLEKIEEGRETQKRSDHIAMWDQFERLDTLWDDGDTRRPAKDRNLSTKGF